MWAERLLFVVVISTSPRSARRLSPHYPAPRARGKRESLGEVSRWVPASLTVCRGSEVLCVIAGCCEIPPSVLVPSDVVTSNVGDEHRYCSRNVASPPVCADRFRPTVRFPARCPHSLF